MSYTTLLLWTLINCYRSYTLCSPQVKTKARRSPPIDVLYYFLSCPTDALTELFAVWDHFPIHHFRRNNKPIIAIGHKPQKQLLTRKLLHPNYIKRALYYQELLKKGHVQSQRALAKHVGISQPKIHLILQMLKLDEKIKDFILKIDDSDPRLNFLTVYRLQSLFQLKSKESQRRKFWQMIKEQYPGQSACYDQVALSGLDS